jgi:uncharacterized protein YkwD
MIALINAERARCGLAPLRIQPILVQVAEAQSHDMVARDFYSHVNPDGMGPCERFDRAGYVWSWCGENIGAGYHTLAEAFSGWRDSASHRANMLLKGATRIGIAAVYTPTSKYKVYWTLILAVPEDGRPY